MPSLRHLGRRQVPFVAASELNECGLACLAAISAFHDGEAGLAEIRELAAASGRGETLLELRNLAERIGLSARGVKVEIKSLAELALPAILHWDMNHFVVLERVTTSGIVVMDPSAGRIVVPWATVDTSFTGVALETRVSAGWRKRHGPRRKPPCSAFSRRSRNGATTSPWSSCCRCSWKCWSWSRRSRCSSRSTARCRAGRPPGLGAGDRLHPRRPAAGGDLGHPRLDARRARRSRRLPAEGPFRRRTPPQAGALLPSPPQRRHPQPQPLVDAIQSLVTAQLLQALLDGVMSVAIVVVMLLSVPSMAAVVIAFAAINLAATAGLRRAAIDVSRRSLRVAAQADAFFLENARAARAIKLFGKELVHINIWRNRFVELTQLGLAEGRLTMFSTRPRSSSNGLGNVALISLGTWLVLDDRITLGTMMMFFLFRAFLVERLNRAVLYAMELRRVRTNAEQIEDVMAEEPGATDAARSGPSSSPTAPVSASRLKDVWFRYGNDSPWLLQGASLGGRAGRVGRHHRAVRKRQDDLAQPDDRPARAGSR